MGLLLLVTVQDAQASPARSTWDRLLAARQSACFALSLRHPFLSE